MGKAYALGTSIIAFFLLGATWDKPEETEQKWFSQPKVEWDSPRKAFESEKQYDKPPRGWYWQDNVGDFPIPKEWPEWVIERFRQLALGERTNDMVQLRRWESDTLELNTPWIDAKSDRVKNYILAKSDRYAFFTIFRLLDNAGNPKEGIVEQDFKGQAKIYGLNEEAQYKIACFDANGVVGTAVTALSDKYIRVYDYSSGNTETAGKSVTEDPNKIVYISSRLGSSGSRLRKIEPAGNVGWEYTDDISEAYGNKCQIDENGDLVWVVGRPWQGYNFRKIEVPSGTLLSNSLQNLEWTGFTGHIAETSDSYVVTVGDALGNYSGLVNIGKSSGVSEHFKMNHETGWWPEYLGLYLKLTCIAIDKDKKRIIAGGYNPYGYTCIDMTSGATIASGQYTKYSPRFAFEDTINQWTHNSQPIYVGWDFGVGNEKTIDRLAYSFGMIGPGCVTGYALYQGSNDAAGWTTLSTFSCPEFDNAGTTTFANSTAYRYYRLYLNNLVSSDPTYIGADVVYLIAGESQVSIGPAIITLNANEGNYQTLRGRIKSIGHFSTDGIFIDICEGYDGSHTAVGYTAGHGGTFIASAFASGATKWEYTFDAGNYPQSISPTEDKGYIISGCSGNPDGGWNIPQAFLLKINKNGKEDWRKYYQINNNGTTFFDAKQTIDKGYIAVGGHRLSATESQIYIVKTNRHGESCSPGVPCE